MAATKTRLTTTAIQHLALPAGQDRVVLQDDRTPGLQLVMRSGGGKTFCLYRRISHRPQRITLGKFPTMTLEQARRAADAYNGEIATGKNPAEIRRKEREEGTIGKMFDDYLAGHAKLHKRSWAGDQWQFDRYLVDWKNRKVSSITFEDVRSLHAKIGRDNGKYAANRTLAMLSKMFNFARLANPCKGVRKFHEDKRDRFLQPDELPRFFKALQDEPNETIRDYILMSLLTGARRGNTMAMAWNEVNIDAGLWRIGMTKNGEALVVHLPEQAVDILRQRKEHQQRNRIDSPYVFPGKSSGHLVEAKAAWAAILKRAGIANLRLHDLRRTLASYQAIGGASLAVIGRSLGHKSTQTTAIYARLTMDPIKNSVNAAVDSMMTLATPKALPAAIADDDEYVPAT